MTLFKQYSLARYRGPSSKTKCPKCGEKTFKPYVDESGQPFSEDFSSADPKIYELAKEVGRCDNERKCGHNYTPGQFFKETKSGVPQHREGWTPPPPQETAKPLDWSIVTRIHKPYESTFATYLRDVAHLPADRLEQTLRDYWIGVGYDRDFHTNEITDRRIAYPMIDINGQCKDIKFMSYKADGHRNHDKNPYWARKRLVQAFFRKNRITAQQKDKFLDMLVIKPCFGEHLLADERYKDKPVALVEGEKSCLICSIMNPRFLWMAVGTNSFNVTKLLPAMQQKRKIYIFPDVDQLEKWERLAKELNYPKSKFMGAYIKKTAQSEKDDVGDIMLREWLTEGERLEIVDETSGKPLGTVAANEQQPIMSANAQQPNTADTMPEVEWTDEDERQYRQMQIATTEAALGLDEPSEPLRTLFEGLDLEIVSGQDFSEDPDYEGF